MYAESFSDSGDLAIGAQLTGEGRAGYDASRDSLRVRPSEYTEAVWQDESGCSSSESHECANSGCALLMVMAETRISSWAEVGGLSGISSSHKNSPFVVHPQEDRNAD